MTTTNTSKLIPQLQNDIDAVQRIPIVDELLDIICATTGMGFAAIARVTDERWIACAVQDKINFGLLPGGELKLETTICYEIMQHKQPVVFDDAVEDETYANHHTPQIYGLRSYISVPIILRNGKFFGTLCAIDPNPALINNRETISMFKFYADLLSFHLDAVEKLEISESRLKEEKETSELREQFIAILGHDLRNPVGAVTNVAQLMLRMPLDDRMKRLAVIIQDSSFRMRELIDNILDFARGKMGRGIILDRKDDEPMEEVLSQVITELELIWPEKTIESNFNFPYPVNCDSKRIAQLFSNLLGNALNYGKDDEPVVVEAFSDANQFTLSISNKGEPIPKAVMKNLFNPFFRGEVKSDRQGLGLGLYIASEIAKAHSGTLTVQSDDGATTFLLEFPLCSKAMLN